MTMFGCGMVQYRDYWYCVTNHNNHTRISFYREMPLDVHCEGCPIKCLMPYGETYLDLVKVSDYLSGFRISDLCLKKNIEKEIDFWFYGEQ